MVGIRDCVQVDLPYAMQEHKNVFENNVLQNLTNAYSAQHLRTGKQEELRVEEVSV